MSEQSLVRIVDDPQLEDGKILVLSGRDQNIPTEDYNGANHDDEGSESADLVVVGGTFITMPPNQEEDKEIRKITGRDQ